MAGVGPPSLGTLADMSDERTEAIQAVVTTSGDQAPLLLIAGSLYLAGEILRLNEQFPD